MRVSRAWRALVPFGVVCSLPAVGAAQNPPATLPETYEVAGIVMDSVGAPIARAEVAAFIAGELRRQVATSADGRFSLGRHPAGVISLHVRRVGYSPRQVEVSVGSGTESTNTEIVLAEVAAELPQVVVESDPNERLRGFFQRRSQRGQFARFLEQSEIRRLGPTNASDLFRNVPGITIRVASTGGNTIRIRNCQPMVWLDGQRIPGAELDEIIHPTEIAAIEFYPSSAGVPAQYVERQNRLCGLILVWTGPMQDSEAAHGG